MFNNFFPENCAAYEIMWKKHGRARQATEDIIQCAKDAISKPDN